jgi:hypothetical protein
VGKRVTVIPGFTAGLCDFKDTLSQTEKVISFIEQKKRTLRLAVICGDIFEYMKPLLSKVLYYRYRAFMGSEEILKALNCSKRTYYRRVSSALISFTKIRERLNLSDEYLENLYGKDKWIMRFKEKAAEEEVLKSKINEIKCLKRKIA